MVTTDALFGIVWGAVAGAALGALFFLGLWATVTRVSRSNVPWALLAGSLLVRLAVLGGGLYLVARGGLWPLVGALVGILAARPVVTRLVVKRGAGTVRSPLDDSASVEEAQR